MLLSLGLQTSIWSTIDLRFYTAQLLVCVHVPAVGVFCEIWRCWYIFNFIHTGKCHALVMSHVKQCSSYLSFWFFLVWVCHMYWLTDLVWVYSSFSILIFRYSETNALVCPVCSKAFSLPYTLKQHHLIQSDTPSSVKSGEGFYTGLTVTRLWH